MAYEFFLSAGWFPANYVEEMDIVGIAQEEADDKDNPLGSLEKYVLNVSGLKVICQRFGVDFMPASLKRSSLSSLLPLFRHPG